MLGTLITVRLDQTHSLFAFSVNFRPGGDSCSGRGLPQAGGRFHVARDRALMKFLCCVWVVLRRHLCLSLISISSRVTTHLAFPPEGELGENTRGTWSVSLRFCLVGGLSKAASCVGL